MTLDTRVVRDDSVSALASCVKCEHFPGKSDMGLNSMKHISYYSVGALKECFP